MFHEQLIEVARRKERLIARCENQRAELAQACHRLEQPARLIDQGWRYARYLRAHPLVLAAAVAAAVVLARRNVFGWGGRAVMAWRVWRTVSGWLRRFSA